MRRLVRTRSRATPIAAGLLAAALAASAFAPAAADDLGGDNDKRERVANSSAAGEAVVVNGTGEVLPVTEQIERDVKQISETDGLDPVSEQDLARQLEFQQAASQVEKDHPDRFVAAKNADKNSEVDYILFLTDEPSGDILNLLEGLSGTTEIRYGEDYPVAIESQTRVFSAALEAVQNYPGAAETGAVAGLTEDRTGVSVTVPLEAAASRQVRASKAREAATEDQLEEEVQSAVSEEAGIDLPVEIETKAPEPIKSYANVVGGRSLHIGAGDYACTAGFTARRQNNGTRGLITARHCPSNLTYRRVSGIIDYLGPAADDDGAVIDLQFHRTLSPHTTQGRYQWTANPDVITDVKRFGNPTDGQNLCKNGTTTGYTCGTVIDPNTCTYSGWPDGTTKRVCRLGWTSVNGAPGDSGGPFFIGDAGSGMMHGGNDTGTMSFYTRIGTVDLFLNSDVLTN